MLELPIKSVAIVSRLAQHAIDIGEKFGFTEKEVQRENFAKYLIEELINYDQPTILRMQMSVRMRLERDEEKKPSPTEELANALSGS
jgi:hypothetical protein